MHLDLRHDTPAPIAAGWTMAGQHRSARAGLSVERWLILVADLAVVSIAMAANGAVGIVAAGCAALFTVLLAWTGDYQRPRASLGAMREVPRLATRLALITSGLLLATSRWADPTFLRAVVGGGAALLVGRFGVYALLRAVRRRHIVSSPTLIVGAGAVGRDLASYLGAHPECGMTVVGVADDADAVRDQPLICGLGELPEVARRVGAERIIVTFGAARDWRLIEVIRDLPATNLEVLIVPRLYEVGAGTSEAAADDVGGIPVAWLHRRSARAGSQRSKRAFDVLVATALLVMSAPVMAACALGVRLSSEGPILFSQVRLGKQGRPFTLYKFRSMQVNDDSATLWSVRDDDRLTIVGRLLRRANLDELPQLFNVLKGDMSLVGPRPERPFFVERFSEDVPGYAQRHRTPVGLTGWAQIHGLRGDTSIQDRVRYDNYYIDNWSMWHDMTILVRTFTAFNRSD